MRGEEEEEEEEEEERGMRFFYLGFLWTRNGDFNTLKLTVFFIFFGDV